MDRNNQDKVLSFSELALLTLSFGSLLVALHFFFNTAI